MVCRGVAECVIAGGRVAVEPSDSLSVALLHAVKGSGRFIPNKPYSEYVYERLRQRAKEAQERKLKVEREPYTGPVVNISI